jgi:hypothetical protein
MFCSRRELNKKGVLCGVELLRRSFVCFAFIMNGFLSCDRFIQYAHQAARGAVWMKWPERRMSWPKRRLGGFSDHGCAF